MKQLERYAPSHPMVQRAVSRIQELANGGIAPTADTYNANRRGAAHTRTLWQHGWLWADLVQLAKLKLPTKVALTPRRSQHIWVDAPTGVPAELEAEIQAVFASGDNVPVSHRPWPLAVIPTRLEVRDYPQPDGSIFRVTRAYASIR